MPRFGDGSARGNDSERKVKRAYVGGATAAGAGVAGAGAAARAAGQRRQAGLENSLSAIRRDRRANYDQAKASRNVADQYNAARRASMQGHPDIIRMRRAIADYDSNVQAPNVKSPGVINGVVVDQRAHTRYLAQFKAKKTRARAASNEAIRQLVVPRRDAARAARAQAAEHVKTGQALGRALGAGERRLAGARNMVRGGKVAIGVGAALPLAALATRNRVARDWKANPRPTRESQGSKLAGRNKPKEDRGGLSLREHKAAMSGDWSAFEAAQRRRNGL